MTAWRLLPAAPASGGWNMALDEALLEQATPDAPPTVRFYGWSEPTVSLGYFQEHTARYGHPPSCHCRLIRRPSGGGAIVHDAGELTYSVTLGANHALANRPKDLYTRVHAAIIATMRPLGVELTLCSHSPQEVDRTCPFLCFQRREPGDILLGHHKVMGSAQRRRRGAVLQHGSLLLRGSQHAPELPGLVELSRPWPHSVEPKEFVDRIVLNLGQVFGGGCVRGEPARSELELASSLMAKKFDTQDWTERR